MLRSSPQDVIINARDPMKNPGQTQMFYKVGQTRLTQAKCDQVNPDDPGDPIWLQCCDSLHPPESRKVHMTSQYYYGN